MEVLFLGEVQKKYGDFMRSQSPSFAGEGYLAFISSLLRDDPSPRSTSRTDKISGHAGRVLALPSVIWKRICT